MDPPPGDGSTTDLDLTNAHLPSLDGVELPATLTDVDLTANRLKELDARVLALPSELDFWRLACFFMDRGWEQSTLTKKIKTARPLFFPSGLRRLSVRQNLVTDAAPLATAANAGGERGWEEWIGWQDEACVFVKPSLHHPPPHPGLEEVILHDNQLTEVRRAS